ncbi:MAG: rhodanese-like domain-containing protein [Cyanobacteriota bacterium]|nr:rhodanese-like domain-containing protein [Cyanobacteriota bacterium]
MPMPTMKLRHPHKIAEAFAGPDGRSVEVPANRQVVVVSHSGSRWGDAGYPPHSPALATHRAMSNTSIKQRISAHDLADQLAEQRVDVIDVREPMAFATGHIPGSPNVPLTRLHQSGYAHPVKVSL